MDSTDIKEKVLLNIKSNLELLKNNDTKGKNEVNQSLILNLSALCKLFLLISLLI